MRFVMKDILMCFTLQAKPPSDMNGDAPKEQRQPRNKNNRRPASGKPNPTMSNGHTEGAPETVQS